MQLNTSLVRYSDAHLEEAQSLVFPPPVPSDSHSHDTLSEQVNAFYIFCQHSNQKKCSGSETMKFIYDLSQRNIKISGNRSVEKVSATSYWIEHRCINVKWEFDIEGNQEVYITSPTKEAIPQELLSGYEHERFFFNSHMFPKITKEEWENWEEKMPAQAHHYETVIYPQIFITIKKICALHPLQQLDIINLRGGSGKLARKILEELSPSIRQIVMIDDSLTLIQRAKEQSQKYADRLVTKHIDIEAMPDELSQSAENFDIAILCAVVAQQVLSKKTALDIMSKCHSMLRQNGIIIAASLSPALINSTDCAKMGYDILNKSITFRDPSQKWRTNDFYVLQKN